MAKPRKQTEPLKHTIIVIDAYWLAAEVHNFSVYVDNNLEIEAVEELATDAELPLMFDLIGESIDIKHITIEDPNRLFQSEVLYALPEEAQDLWTLLDNEATKVDKGIWRVKEDLAEN